MSPAKKSDRAADVPVGEAEFAALMQALELPQRPFHIAVAVSGGADSMALMHLLAPWRQEQGVRLSVLTVDHGLRPEAADETAFVLAAARRLGLGAARLSTAVAPGANLQARARQARYDVLEAWCREKGADSLALAHHLDDQAETIVMRLSRGSNLWGLAGMKSVSGGLTPGAPLRLRPVLGVPKSRLIATLRALGETWVEDPSNENPAFERVRIRQNWAALERLGLHADRLAETARHLGEAREALERDVDALLHAACVIDPGGFARLCRTDLRSAPRAVGLRALAHVLMAVGGRPYAPRSDALQRLFAQLSGTTVESQTLSGCRISLLDDEHLLFVRESRGVERVHLSAGRTLHWDRRFWLEGRDGLCIDRLGLPGQRALRDMAGRDIDHLIPAPARRSLPALFDAAGLLSVPSVGFSRTNAPLPALEFAPPVAIPDEIVRPWRLSAS